MSKHVETLVVGAGPAGLTAAYVLAREGRGVAVLEQDPRYVGGISRTIDYKGFLIDIGGHRFFSRSSEIVALWDEILPDDFLDRPRLSRIYYGGAFYAYPLRAIETLRNLGFLKSAACVASYLQARLRPVREPKTLHQWVRNNFGERLFSIFFKTYTEKVWGMSCDEISADWAAQRIKGLDLGAAIRDAIRRATRPSGKAGGEAGIKTLIESFRYPRRGPGMMWEAAAAKIAANGGTVALGRSVQSLSWDESRGRWTVEARLADGATETWTAEHVVSSAALVDLAHALKPPTSSLPHARALSYRDFLIVGLIARNGEHIPDNWIYIHDPSVKVGRIQNFAAWSPEMVPDPRYVSLGMEYFCFEDDGLWSMGDADLIEMAKAEIAQIGLIRPEDVVDACVIRQPKAYPVYDEHYAHHVAHLRHDLEASFPTLHLVGRNGMHRYNNQDHAMMTAILAARNIIAGERLYDPWGVNDDAEYGEEGVAGSREALQSERMVPRRAGLEAATVPAQSLSSTRSGPRPAGILPRIALAALVVLQVALIVTHGPWRDELQALMLANHTASLGALFASLHYEGHPALWYLLLRALSPLGDGPETLKIAQIAVALSTIAIVWLRAPFSPWVRLLILASYLLLFEWGTIARSYGLGAMLYFAFLAFNRRPLAAWLLLGLIANVSAHFLLLAGVTGLLLLALDRKPSPWLILFPVLVTVAILTAWPASDAATAIGLPTSLGNRIVDATASLSGALVPFDPTIVPPHWYQSLGPSGRAVGAFVLFVGAAALFRRSAASAVLYALLALAVIAFGAIVYPTAARHVGVVFLFLIGAEWLLGERDRGPVSKISLAWITVLAASGLWISAFALTLPFGPMNGLRHAIAQHDLGAALWIADPAVVGVEVSGRLGRPYYDPDRQCLAWFHVWKPYRGPGFDPEAFDALLVQTARASGGRVALLSARDFDPARTPHLQQLATLQPSLLRESATIYMVTAEPDPALPPLPLCE